MMKETLTFYTPYSHFGQLIHALKEVYHTNIQDVSYTDSMVYIQLVNQGMIQIRYATNEYNVAYLRQKLMALFQIVDQRDCERRQIKDSLLQQILLFHGVYEIVFTYDTARRKDKIVSLMEVADKLTALILWETQDISNSFGDIILSRDGSSEVTQFYPIDEASLCIHHYDLTDEQLLRMHRSTQILRHKGIYAPSNLEIPHKDAWYLCQDKEDIIKRCLACMITAMYAGILLDQKWSSEKAYDYVKQLIQLYDVQIVFSVKEIEFLSHPNPSEEECRHFYRGNEYCIPFLWAIGFIDQLHFPNAFSDPSTIIHKMFAYASIEQMAQEVVLRPLEEMLDMMDLIQRYRWSIMQTKNLGFETPAHLHPEVVEYWYQAWKWMVNTHNTSWDEVDEEIDILSPA